MSARLGRVSALLAAAGLGSVALAGCAPQQSLAEACGLLQTSMVEITDQLTASLSELQSDPELARTALIDAGAQLDELLAEITQEDALATVTEMDVAYDAFLAEFEAVLDGESTDTAAYLAAAEEMQVTFAASDAVCAAEPAE